MTDAAEDMVIAALFRWANEHAAHGMPYQLELEAQGWVKIRQHPNYPKSWLMRKGAT